MVVMLAGTETGVFVSISVCLCSLQNRKLQAKNVPELNLPDEILETAVGADTRAVAAALLRKLAMLVYAGFLTRFDDHKSASPEPEKVEGTQEYFVMHKSSRQQTEAQKKTTK